MLAKDVNDNACLLVKRGALETIASKLAPTGDAFVQEERVIVDVLRRQAGSCRGSRLFRKNAFPW
ncbi:hypothetical protein PMA3_20265 [Pseudomonas silesiensis]|uniref:Uncharacterized protein n=1 Tax=Pseudomonas silesiensis TaxID=1853130 RepID=A0A191YWV3_9PSED|nr:hypothetical protein PMA3_20265 [Pseudomonas silesiensis]